jgi:uncharacterized protein YbjT (DUF2867 family)
MTVLITGSRGRVARTLTALLHTAGHAVRAGSRSPESLDPPGGVAAVPLSLAEPAGFPAALDGVRSVFLYAEASHIARFLAAAEAAGVEHIVLLSSSSVLAPGARGDTLARHHVEVEEALAASPITTTVLRPGTFASNALQWAWPIKATGAVHLPYPGAHTDPVHEADLAEAAFAALTDPEVRGGTYHLTGPASVTFAAQITTLAQVTGLDIRAVAVGPDAWKAETAEYLPEVLADALLAFWKAHDGSPAVLTDTLEQLIGHPPRTFEEWAADHSAAFTR